MGGGGGGGGGEVEGEAREVNWYSQKRQKCKFLARVLSMIVE